ncbi:MAG: RHS repeat-associated core domain-containing protein [Eubacteriales bacterium]|nr:RHS repeat-associated core domain-containing protein [Eubacteriales bacterium]
MRTQKVYEQDVTNYYYNGSVLIGMTAGSIYQRFSYDSSGRLVAVDYSTNSGSTYTTYYYVRNGQGDIIKLIDGSGNTVVQYTYDTWGKQTSCTGTLATSLGQNQPFRYRGYVYDAETGWYYLQSRYYNPEVGRFISSDVLLSTGQGVLGHNSYAYCLNNPVNMSDLSGTSSFDNDWISTCSDGGSPSYKGRREKKRRAIFIYYDYEETTAPLEHFAFAISARMDYQIFVYKGVSSFEDLTREWNAIDGDVDDVYLFIHSSTEGFALDKEGVYYSDFSGFEEKNFRGKVYFYSCHASGFAEKFAKATKTRVVATSRGVSYSCYNGTYYVRTDKLSIILGNGWREYDGR